jgi:hypothetical protein
MLLNGCQPTMLRVAHQLDYHMSRHIAEYLVQAWDVRNTYKHSGAVLPFPSAPVGRGVDGIDAMALLVT